jgi:hypothetical protein
MIFQHPTSEFVQSNHHRSNHMGGDSIAINNSSKRDVVSTRDRTTFEPSILDTSPIFEAVQARNLSVVDLIRHSAVVFRPPTNPSSSLPCHQQRSARQPCVTNHLTFIPSLLRGAQRINPLKELTWSQNVAGRISSSIYYTKQNDTASDTKHECRINIIR